MPHHEGTLERVHVADFTLPSHLSRVECQPSLNFPRISIVELEFLRFANSPARPLESFTSDQLVL